MNPQEMKGRILILNWRDPANPRAGGAEQATIEMFSRVAARGYEVTWFAGMFPGAPDTEIDNGITFVRQGGQATVHFRAWRWYKKQTKSATYDLVVDEINTIPFLTPLYVKANRIAYINQLAREVWFHEAFFPLSVIGYVLERFYIRIYRKERIVTISESTKNDLMGLGFSERNVDIVDMGMDIEPVVDLEAIRKEEHLTLLYFGSLRSMKRVSEAVKTFAYVREAVPDARMWIAGAGDKKNKARLERLIGELGLHNSVEFKGTIPHAQKRELMGRAHFLVFTSVREGWGLVVIEANAAGTPAAVYDVPGLRDSVIDGKAGIVSPDNDPQLLAARILEVVGNPDAYQTMRTNAYDRSKLFNWSHSADALLKIVERSLDNPDWKPD